MVPVFNWTVTAMDCYPQVDSDTDVVFNVHWICSGAQGQYESSIYNTCAVPGPGDPFTPYAALTQEQVLSWIWANGVDKDATEAAVTQQLQSLVNPPVVQPPLPWGV